MQPDNINSYEVWLVVYASGFALDKFATVLGSVKRFQLGFVLLAKRSVLEHGMGIYVRNLWNSIDLCFCAIFGLYLVLRILDLSDASSIYFAESLNVLACGAVILFPRLAFLVVSNNALVGLSDWQEI